MSNVGSPSEPDREGARVSVRVTAELYTALIEQAAAERRSLSNLVTLLLEDGLKVRGKVVEAPAVPKSPRTPGKRTAKPPKPPKMSSMLKWKKRDD